MRDRIQSSLRIAVLILLGLIAWQLSQALFKANPLAHAVIPAIPTLSTNPPAGDAKTNRPPAGNNLVVAEKNTAPEAPAADRPGTSSPAATNLAATGATNPPPSASHAPGLISAANAPATSNVVNRAATNAPAPDTALAATQTVTVGHTNLVAAETNASLAGTNRTAKKAPKHAGGPGGMMLAGGGFPGGFPGFGGPGGPAPKLPPAAQARVDKIVSSEIFAPVFHPLPMALMGIAGDTAFIRGPDGQTGLVKAGDSLGQVKLLRIGVNRVLVDQSGEKKELLIFDGYGSESLLSTTNGSSK